MATWLVLLVLSFATFRITRLIVRDDFPPILWARNKIILAKPVQDRYDPNTRPETQGRYTDWWWLGELVTCAWCASGWVSLLFVGITWAMIGLPLPIFCWFAVWGLGALLCKIAA